MLKSDGALFVGQRDIGFDAPGPPLGRVADTSRVVLRQTRTKILRSPDVEPIVIRIALQNVNVGKCTPCNGLPSRSSLRLRGKIKRVRLRQGSVATVYALRYRCERRLEARGFEPLTSSLQSWRSTN